MSAIFQQARSFARSALRPCPAAKRCPVAESTNRSLSRIDRLLKARTFALDRPATKENDRSLPLIFVLSTTDLPAVGPAVA